MALGTSFFAIGVVGSNSLPAAEQTKQATKAGSSSHVTKAPMASSRKPYRHPVGELPASARQFYELAWGVDGLAVKLAESGQLVRFSYRVTDIAKATALQDRASTPQLFAEKIHAVLQVPTMEKVGPLRQATPPEAGKSYWMVFSNKGNLVKSGHRVSIVIGSFRVDGLIVQ